MVEKLQVDVHSKDKDNCIENFLKMANITKNKQHTFGKPAPSGSARFYLRKLDIFENLNGELKEISAQQVKPGSLVEIGFLTSLTYFKKWFIGFEPIVVIKQTNLLFKDAILDFPTTLHLKSMIWILMKKLLQKSKNTLIWVIEFQI